MQGRIALEELNRELDAAKSSIEAWAEAKTTSAVELRRKHAKLLEEHKGNVSELRARQQSLAREAEQIKQKLATELSEETALEAEVRNLEVEGSEAGGQLQALQGIVSGKSADLTTREADLAVQKKAAAERLKELKNALNLFTSRLGLSFELSNDVQEELCLVFTNIDSADPDRKFVVGIRVQPGNQYEVTTCKPAVHGVEESQKILNKTGNFGFFVQTMRKKFKQQVAGENEAQS